MSANEVRLTPLAEAALRKAMAKSEGSVRWPEEHAKIEAMPQGTVREFLGRMYGQLEDMVKRNRAGRCADRRAFAQRQHEKLKYFLAQYADPYLFG